MSFLIRPLYFVYAAFSWREKSQVHDDFYGFMGLFFLASTVISAFVFGLKIFGLDLPAFFSSCCSFGPKIPRNPFSDRAAVSGCVIVPLGLLLAWWLSGVAKKDTANFSFLSRVMEKKMVALIFVFAFVALAPYAVNGAPGSSWATIGWYGVIWLVLCFWLRFREYGGISG